MAEFKTVHVYTYHDFMNALELATGQCLEIVVKRDIQCMGQELAAGVGLDGYETQHRLRIVGSAHQPAIDFGCWFDEDWTDVPEEPNNWINGMGLESLDVEIENLRLRNYHSFGSGVRVHDGGTLVVDTCIFENIGDIIWTPRTTPYDNSHDSCWANGIGAFFADSIVVRDTQFISCCQGDIYAHCIYGSADVIEISGCTFQGCGQAINLTQAGVHTIINNRFLDLVETPVYQDHDVWPWLVDLTTNTQTIVFRGNTVTGTYDKLHNWNAADEPDLTMNDNDFSGAALADEDAQTWWSNWLAAGHDADSEPPSNAE